MTYCESMWRAGWVWLFVCCAANAAIPEKVRFNEHVRPILSSNCFYCHGPDPKHREADLRLDTSEGATADHDGHSAVVPGKANLSALIKRVTSTDPDERMPPPDSKKPRLTDEQIAILQRWIEQGAEYQPHWSLIAPTQICLHWVTPLAMQLGLVLARVNLWP